jgi:hypothetical protein
LLVISRVGRMSFLMVSSFSVVGVPFVLNSMKKYLITYRCGITNNFDTCIITAASEDEAEAFFHEANANNLWEDEFVSITSAF